MGIQEGEMNKKAFLFISPFYILLVFSCTKLSSDRISKDTELINISENSDEKFFELVSYDYEDRTIQEIDDLVELIDQNIDDVYLNEIQLNYSENNYPYDGIPLRMSFWVTANKFELQKVSLYRVFSMIRYNRDFYYNNLGHCVYISWRQTYPDDTYLIYNVHCLDNNYLVKNIFFDEDGEIFEKSNIYTEIDSNDFYMDMEKLVNNGPEMEKIYNQIMGFLDLQ